MHSFCSPLSNNREDQYGGSLENRIRFPLEIAQAVRGEWSEKPLIFRVSATDWAEGPEGLGNVWKQWGIQQTIHLCRTLSTEVGVDLINCSSGGLWHKQKIPVEPGYQVRLFFVGSSFYNLDLGPLCGNPETSIA